MPELPKLIRDRIPEIAEQNGDRLETREVEGEELREFVLKKVVEEAEEVREAGEVEELADLVEVVEKFKQLEDIEDEEIEKLRNKKNEERGAFEENIVLEEIL